MDTPPPTTLHTRPAPLTPRLGAKWRLWFLLRILTRSGRRLARLMLHETTPRPIHPGTTTHAEATAQIAAMLRSHRNGRRHAAKTAAATKQAHAAFTALVRAQVNAHHHQHHPDADRATAADLKHERASDPTQTAFRAALPAPLAVIIEATIAVIEFAWFYTTLQELWNFADWASLESLGAIALSAITTALVAVPTAAIAHHAGRPHAARRELTRHQRAVTCGSIVAVIVSTIVFALGGHARFAYANAEDSGPDLPTTVIVVLAALFAALPAVAAATGYLAANPRREQLIAATRIERRRHTRDMRLSRQVTASTARLERARHKLQCRCDAFLADVDTSRYDVDHLIVCVRALTGQAGPYPGYNAAPTDPGTYRQALNLPWPAALDRILDSIDRTLTTFTADASAIRAATIYAATAAGHHRHELAIVADARHRGHAPDDEQAI